MTKKISGNNNFVNGYWGKRYCSQSLRKCWL